jgi:4-hydroxy-3-methylbut-2-enyl diphosphate reductase
MGFLIFVLYISVVGLGGTYGINLPAKYQPGFIPDLKNIPASKDIFVGLAWIIVTVFIPYLSARKAAFPLVPILFTFGITYVRTVLFDLRDIYTDQIVGREAVPMLFGKEKATSTMYGVLMVVSVMLLLQVVIGWQLAGSVACLIGIAYLLGFIQYNQNNVWAQSAKFDLFLDAQYFIVAALVFVFGR